MKKYLHFIAATALFAAAACSKEPVSGDTPLIPEGLVELSFDASVPEDSKADVFGLEVLWSEGDQIKIYEDADWSSPQIFTLASGAGTKNAVFTGTVSAASTEFYAVYPASAGAAFTSGSPSTVKVSVPTEQTVPAGAHCDPAALVSVAKAEGKSLKFHNAVALARFTVDSDDIKRISLASAGGVSLVAGTVSVDAATGELTAAPTGNYVALNVPGAGTWYAAVAPSELDGVLLSFSKGESKGIRKSSRKANLQRNGCLDFGNVSSGASYAGMTISNAAELQAWADAAGAYVAGETVRVIADIDMSGVSFNPALSFAATLDGGGHSIKNWISSVPLLDALRTDGELKDLTIASSCVLTFPEDLSYFGFVAKVNRGSISDITMEASASVPQIKSESTQDGRFGLIVGNNAESGSVTGCTTSGSMDMSTPGIVASNNLFMGQVLGRNAGYVSGCNNLGDVNVEFADDAMTKCLYAGGICGLEAASGIMEACTNSGSVTIKTPGSGKDCLFACGVVGYSSGRLIECINTGSVSVLSESSEGAGDGPFVRACAAGVAGYSQGEMSNCENSGSVTLRGGYSAGFAGVGSLSAVSNVAAGVVGLVYDAEVNDCINTGDVSSTLLNIDNAASNYNTSTRATIGGVIGNLQGTATSCVNEGTVDAYWVTSAHDAGLKKQFVTQAGGVCGGAYVSKDKTVTSIVSCENSGTVRMTCDSNASNNTIGGIVGWPGSESGNKGGIFDCINSGNVIADGFGMSRVGGITGGTAPVSGGKVSGTITLAGKITGSYVGGVAGYCAKDNTIQDVVVDGLTIDYTYETGMNSVVYGIGGLIGQPQNVTGAVFAPGCSVLVTVKSNHSRDIGFLGGRNTNKEATNTMTFGTAEKPVSVKKGCEIIVNGSSVAKIETAADVEKVVTTPGTTGNLMGALWYDNWGEYFTSHVVFSE